MEDNPRYPVKHVSATELKNFFTSHLNRIYSAKKQFADKLPVLRKSTHFTDLQQAVEETAEAVKAQIVRMDEIYNLLNAKYKPESCIGLTGWTKLSNLSVFQMTAV